MNQQIMKSFIRKLSRKSHMSFHLHLLRMGHYVPYKCFYRKECRNLEMGGEEKGNLGFGFSESLFHWNPKPYIYEIR